MSKYHSLSLQLSFSNRLSQKELVTVIYIDMRMKVLKQEEQQNTFYIAVCTVL